MKQITYNNKKLKLPYDLKDGELSTQLVTRQNPFSGQSIQLPEFAAVIYDRVIHLNLKAEMKDKAMGMEPGFSDNQDDWQLVRNGINFFRHYFAEEQMERLDQQLASRRALRALRGGLPFNSGNHFHPGICIHLP